MIPNNRKKCAEQAGGLPRITVKDMLCEAVFESTKVQQLDVLCRALNAELADMGLVPVSDWVRHHSKDCYVDCYVCKVDWIEDVEAEKGRGYNELIYRTWSGA